jgi:hypothetical protein
MTKWTKDMDRAAWAHGWGIFDVDGRGILQIQRLDSVGMFASDEEAVAYVREQATKGSKLCQTALEIVGGQA